MQELKVVLAAGATGGLGSWAYTVIVGTTFGIDNMLALPLCVILGAISALIAVYVITPTDTSKLPKLFGYAVLCGMMWKPVLDAAKIAISERLSYAQEQKVITKNVEDIATATAPVAPAKIDAAASSATELLRTSDTLGNPKLEEHAKEQAESAVEAIADNAKKDPESAERAKVALETIAVAAEATDNQEVANKTRLRIRGIEMMLNPKKFTAGRVITPPPVTATATQ